MKAEKRKELHTNLLADQMGKLVQRFKTRPSSNSLMIWVGIGLIGVTVLVWWIYSGKAKDERSALWVQMDAALHDDVGAPEKLEKVAQNHRRTVPGRIARFQIARRNLQEGVRHLPSETGREDAIKKLESARADFTELAGEVVDDTVLGPEALMNRARAEEALAGVQKVDDAEQGRGDLKTALENYRAVVNKYPDSAEAQVAKERLKIYEDKKKFAELEGFYRTLREAFGGKSALPPGHPPITPRN